MSSPGDAERADAPAPMTPDRWRVVKSIVQQALDRPPAAREAFVADACGGDAELRAEVDSLVADPEPGADSGGFLASPSGLGAIVAAAVARIESQSTDGTGAAEAADDADVAVRSAALSAALAGRYELDRVVGRGGMATVWLARDLRHRRRVALKVLHPELGALLGPRRFLREIETAANLSHPHILPLHDSGRVALGEEREDGLLYYVMPYVAGESLRARLRREGRLAMSDVLRLLREVAAALDYAHRHGVVHRDVKPENILLDEDGHALVADFGIARGREDDVEGAGDAPGSGADSITERGRVIGTPAYMSPEQARGRRDLDGRSDQYSLACVAYELLAGQAPFAGTSAEQLAERPTQAPASLAERRPDLPSATDAVLTRALALDPEARFDTTSAFADALASSMSDVSQLDDRTALAALDVATPESARPSRRRRLILGAGLAAAGALVVALVVRESRPPRAAPAPAGPPVLAVLPFENLGPPSDAYFADGLTDELTGRLAAVSGLRVIAAASARQYRGSTKEPREIARELGATHLLTGTVRWEHAAGGIGGARGAGRVRVRPELVRVADQATMWTEPVEGSLQDVFLVQASVAERVAASLHVELLAGERRAAAAPPTRNLAAYDAYLRAVANLGNGFLSSATAQRAAVAELERAVALDPTFVAAHARLATAYAWIHFVTGDSALRAQARASAERAWTLDSTAVESRHVRVAYLIWVGDLEGAHRAASALVATAPGLAASHDLLGSVEEARGDVDASIASYRRAATLDPRAPGPVERIASLHQRAYRYAESIEYRERHLALAPEAISYWMYMMSHLSWRADTAAASRVATRGGPELEGMLVRLPSDGGMAALWHQALGPTVWRARDTLTLAGYSGGDGGLPPELFLLMKLRHFALSGRPDRMRAYADSAIAQLEPALRRGPDVTLFQTYSRRAILAEAYARLGRTGDASREIDRYVADVRSAPRSAAASIALVNAAYVDVLAGRRDQAVSRLSEALRLPSGIFVSPALLREEASWAPLRGHPGFERLIAER